MRKILTLSSIAAVLALAGPTLAQAPAAKTTTHAQGVLDMPLF